MYPSPHGQLLTSAPWKPRGDEARKTFPEWSQTQLPPFSTIRPPEKKLPSSLELKCLCSVWHVQLLLSHPLALVRADPQMTPQSLIPAPCSPESKFQPTVRAPRALLPFWVRTPKASSCDLPWMGLMRALVPRDHPGLVWSSLRSVQQALLDLWCHPKASTNCFTP